MAHGGRRPGAGRPPKGVMYLAPVRTAENKIRDRLPWLVDKLLELADGVYEKRTIGNSEVLVYKTRPDRQAAEYLIDRVLGKALARSEAGQPGDFDAEFEDVSVQQIRDALRTAV